MIAINSIDVVILCIAGVGYLLFIFAYWWFKDDEIPPEDRLPLGHIDKSQDSPSVSEEEADGD